MASRAQRTAGVLNDSYASAARTNAAATRRFNVPRCVLVALCGASVALASCSGPAPMDAGANATQEENSAFEEFENNAEEATTEESQGQAATESDEPAASDPSLLDDGTISFTAIAVDNRPEPKDVSSPTAEADRLGIVITAASDDPRYGASARATVGAPRRDPLNLTDFTPEQIRTLNELLQLIRPLSRCSSQPVRRIMHVDRLVDYNYDGAYKYDADSYDYELSLPTLGGLYDASARNVVLAPLEHGFAEVAAHELGHAFLGFFDATKCRLHPDDEGNPIYRKWKQLFWDDDGPYADEYAPNEYGASAVAEDIAACFSRYMTDRAAFADESPHRVMFFNVLFKTIADAVPRELTT